MARIRMFEMAKLLGVKSPVLIDLLHENDINKTNFAKIDGDDLACMCHLLFKDNIQLQSIKSKNYNKTIIKMAQYPKYHNTLKFLVHMINDTEKRKIIIEQIALINPYFSTQILMTICNEIEEEREYLLDILKRLYSLSNSEFNRYLLIMAILQLEKVKEIEKLFEDEKELTDFCKVVTLLEHFNIDTEKQLALIELFIKFKKFKEIEIILKDMEDTDSFDKMQVKKAIYISNNLEHVGRLDLSYRLLIMADYKKEALDIFNSEYFDIEKYCKNELAISHYHNMLKVASNKLNYCNFGDITKKQLAFIDFLLKNDIFCIDKNELTNIVIEILNFIERSDAFNKEYGDMALSVSENLKDIGRFDLSYRLLITADLRQEALRLIEHVKFASFRGTNADARAFFSALKKSNHLEFIIEHDKERQSEVLDFLIKKQQDDEIKEIIINMENFRSCIKFNNFYKSRKGKKGFKEYLELKYNLNNENINQFSFWQNIIKNENEPDKLFRSLLAKNINGLKKDGQINVIVGNEVLRVLRSIQSSNVGKDNNAVLKTDQKPKQLLNFEHGMEKQLTSCSDSIFKENSEQFHSLIKDEKNFLKDNNLKSGLLKEYTYVKENVINNKESTEKSYELFNLFNVCLHKYQSEENFVRLYFNSPLKLGIKFEYLVEKLREQFNCKNKKLKFLFKEYFIKGKISEINENYLTIKPLNLNTDQEYRMNLNGLFLKDDKQKDFLKIDGICYFTFDFIKEINNKKVFFVQLANT